MSSSKESYKTKNQPTLQLDYYQKLKIATSQPGGFAMMTSNFTWQFPKHLQYLNTKLLQVASGKVTKSPVHKVAEQESHSCRVKGYRVTSYKSQVTSHKLQVTSYRLQLTVTRYEYKSTSYTRIEPRSPQVVAHVAPPLPSASAEGSRGHGLDLTHQEGIVSAFDAEKVFSKGRTRGLMVAQSSMTAARPLR